MWNFPVSEGFGPKIYFPSDLISEALLSVKRRVYTSFTILITSSRQTDKHLHDEALSLNEISHLGIREDIKAIISNELRNRLSGDKRPKNYT